MDTFFLGGVQSLTGARRVPKSSARSSSAMVRSTVWPRTTASRLNTTLPACFYFLRAATAATAALQSSLRLERAFLMQATF